MTGDQTEMTREELLVENKRLLGTLQRLGEAYQIREENFLEWIAATKRARVERDRYRLAWKSARKRAARAWQHNAAILAAKGEDWESGYLAGCEMSHSLGCDSVEAERDLLKERMAELQRRYAEVCAELRERVP